MKLTISVAAMLVMLSACGEKSQGTAFLEAAQNAVKLQLIDPESAQFSLVEVGDKTVCGWVNAKNRMGGYVGRKPFIVHVQGDGGYATAEPALLMSDETDPDTFYRAQAECPGSTGEVARSVFGTKDAPRKPTH